MVRDRLHQVWQQVPATVRGWLSTYAGPVLGLLVVTALLVNLGAQDDRDPDRTSARESEAVASTRPSRMPDLVTVTPQYAAAGGGPAQRALTGRAQRPAELQLSNGVTVPVRAVGTTTDGQLDVPDDIRTAGWWNGGARLGDPFGSMLIAAHVDSRTQGLGPYVMLLSVRPGAKFTVTGGRGLTQTFAVSERRVVPRERLSSVPDVFSPSGTPRLTMVTCAGPYERANGGYQNLAVVTARPVAPAYVPAG